MTGKGFVRGVTFGCWDLLHAGHVRLLKRARDCCDYLIVGIPSDEVVEQDKGSKPIIDLLNRRDVLAALQYVNEIRTYRELEFMTTLKHTRPDILFIGEFWGNDKRHVEALKWMLDRNKEVIKLPYTSGISTSDIIQKIKDQR